MSGISNVFIDSILSPICHKFIGVYSANTLPNYNIPTTFSLVCNLSPLGEPGSHFVTVISQKECVLYVDSLGFTCVTPQISQFLHHLKKPVLYNTLQIQDFESNFCGFYCILFCLFYDKPRLLSLKFSKTQLKSNDVRCIKFIQQILK